MRPPWPPLRPLVEPILGAPYAQYDCWGLTAYLLKAGWGIDLGADPDVLTAQFVQVWFQGDPQPVTHCLQPWDALILSLRGLVGDHVGMVVDPLTLVHTRRRAGVVLDQVRRWEEKVLQIVRLRQLV